MRARSWISMTRTNNPLWKGHDNGFFTVKSAYFCLNQSKDALELDKRGENSDTSQMVRFWKTIWKAKVQGKIKNLIWRIFHNFLPVAQNLNKRGCVVDMHCWFCGCPEETASYIFLQCWWACAFWNFLGFKHIIGMATIGDVGDWL